MTQGSTNAAENRHVAELRRRVKGLMSEELFEDDSVFKRFLRARNHNVDAAEEMLRKHLQWRKATRIDTILADHKKIEVLEKYIPLNFLGYDKDDAPIYYLGYGNIDIKGLVKSVKKNDALQFFMRYFEYGLFMMKKQSEKVGKKVDKWVYILDFENFTLANATDKTAIDFLLNLMKMYDANYPERLKTAYLINASFYFTIPWAILKPFLAPATSQKVKIFGKDGWREEFQKELGSEVMPAFLGGNRTDPDGNPMCNTFIKHGGIVPQRYYAHRDRKSFSKLPGIKKVVVNRRSKVDIKLEVLHPGSNIEWDFDIKNRDIGFSLFYNDTRAGDKEVEELIPKQRIDTLIESESGMVKCEKPGIYILQFDNSFSWMHNKEIYYSASVVNPNDIIEEDED